MSIKDSGKALRRGRPNRFEPGYTRKFHDRGGIDATGTGLSHYNDPSDVGKSNSNRNAGKRNDFYVWIPIHTIRKRVE